MMALPLTADCVGMWRFEETGATDNAADSSGNGYDLTQSDSPAVVSGTVGTYARRMIAPKRFYLTSGTYPLCRPASGDITVAMIVKPLSGYSHNLPRCLMVVPRNWSSYYLPGYGICSKSYNKMDFRFDVKVVGDASTYSAGGASELTADVWHLLVGTFDASAMTVNWYVDGALVESVSTAPYDTIDLVTGGSPAPMYVGANPYFIVAGISYWAYCDIDEMAIYTSAKNAEWVGGVYNNTLGARPELVSLMLEYVPEPTLHRLNIERRLLETTGSAAAGQGPQLSSLLFEHIPDEHVHRLGATRRKT